MLELKVMGFSHLTVFTKYKLAVGKVQAKLSVKI